MAAVKTSLLLLADSPSDQPVSPAGAWRPRHRADRFLLKGHGEEYLFALIHWLPATVTTKRVSWNLMSEVGLWVSTDLEFYILWFLRIELHHCSVLLCPLSADFCQCFTFFLFSVSSSAPRGGRFTVIDHSPVSDLRVENCRVKLHSLQKNLFRLHTAHKALLLRTDTQ